MRTGLLSAVMIAAAASLSAQQRGVVNRLTASAAAVEVGKPISFTALGANPCGAVNIDYGDGNVVTHPISEVPATIAHTYDKPGTYQVVARGMGNCDGQAAVALRVDALRPSPPAAVAGPAPAPAGALDQNRDGVISRAEWSWDDDSFRTHDWNRDAILSGDEVREAQQDDDKRRAAATAAAERAARARPAAEASDRRFTDLDRNRDGRISRDEWDGSRSEFEQLDRDSDWVLTKVEMGLPAAGNAPARNAPGTVMVQANQPWTDTGLSVRAGDLLTFEASGTVRLSADPNYVTDARGSRTGGRAAGAPVRQAPAGVLIARIGESAAVDVGSRETPIRAPRDGRLYLGVNDDVLADNQGAFQVKVTVQQARRR